MEDDPRWKTNFDGWHPSMEDDLRWKTTFERVYSILPETNLRLLTLTVTAQLTPNRKSYQLSKLEIEFHVMKEMNAALHKGR